MEIVIKKYFSIFLLLALLAGNKDLCAQTPDSAKANGSFLAEGHLGIGLQKGVFAGGEDIILGFILGSDVGYYPFSKDYSYTLSMTFGWMPEYSRTHPGIFYSLVLTSLDFIKFDKVRTAFTTLNIGWQSRNKKNLGYSFSIGGGMKSVTTSPITISLFINVEASIGYSFY